MAKLKAPLLSLGASGAIGKALVFFGWKGLNVVREYVIPANPKTKPQTTQRGYLTKAVDTVHAAQALPDGALNQTDVSAYALWAAVVKAATTWFNQAVRNMIDQQILGKTANVYRDGAVTPEPGGLTVSVYSHAQAPTEGAFWYGTSRTALISSKPATFDAGKCLGDITDLTKGTKYFIQFRPTAPDSLVGSWSGIYYGTPT
ncbi:hypothetical protein ES708_29729 [subsurface metagenome]